jgi:hypothetical protein
MKKILMLSCLLTVASAALQASPVTYSLTFTGGPPLPSGSFNYDASLAVNPFSSFLVTDAGTSFDLTNAANSFTGNSLVGVCKSSQSAAGLFNALTTPGCESGWIYLNLGPSGQRFQISVCSAAFSCDDGGASALVPGNNGQPGGNSFGGISATPASATPEPGTLWLSGTGIAALMARAWARRKR